MRRDLPPLPAIRVFDAAARHGTFTAAAEDLGMTQAAVSYQIKVLEERVGAPLFERHARGVVLSETGMRLHQRAAAALDILVDAYADARAADAGTLSISAIPTFATNFLAGRLGRFQLDNPELAVRLEISETLVDLVAGEVDVAIRGGRGEWPGLASHPILPTTFTPMASPGLLAQAGGVSRPEHLLALPRLSQGDGWWRRWLSCVGLAEPEAGPDNAFGAQVIEAGAAMAGHGVAMLTPAFFQDELARGDLVQPFETVSDDGSGYWLVYAKGRRMTAKIRRFRGWLEKETAGFRSGQAIE